MSAKCLPLFFCIVVINLTTGLSYNLAKFPNLDISTENENDIQIATAPTPPDHNNHLAMARFVVHQADWVSFATISTIKNITGYPFANVVSMVDGTLPISTGIPYFYLTSLDFTHIDLSANNKCTVTVTLQQTGYCTEQNFEPDDPRCSRIMLSGSIKALNNNTEEYEFAKEALFSRHPAMTHYPSNHGFYVAKLEINQIVMLDWFGGPAYLSVDDYLKFNDTKIYRDYPHIVKV